MKFFVLLSFLFFSANSFAQAPLHQRGEVIFFPVEGTTLKLLGAGIRDKDTNAALTLACVGKARVDSAADSSYSSRSSVTTADIPGNALADAPTELVTPPTQPTCDRLRWVMVFNSQSYFVGPEIYQAGPEIYQAAVSKADKKALRRYLKGISKETKKLERNALVALGTGVGAFGAAALVISNPFSTATGVVLLAGWFILVPNLGNLSKGPALFSGNAALKSADQTGWNWANDAKAIKHNAFKYVFWQAAGLNRQIEDGFPSFHKPTLAYWVRDAIGEDSYQLMESMKLN